MKRFNRADLHAAVAAVALGVWLNYPSGTPEPGPPRVSTFGDRGDVIHVVHKSPGVAFVRRHPGWFVGCPECGGPD